MLTLYLNFEKIPTVFDSLEQSSLKEAPKRSHGMLRVFVCCGKNGDAV